MIATMTYRGSTYKAVTVSEFDPESTTESEVRDAALAAARESRSSTFGSSVRFVATDDVGLVAYVTIHTD